jgi:hypothetical protein
MAQTLIELNAGDPTDALGHYINYKGSNVTIKQVNKFIKCGADMSQLKINPFLRMLKNDLYSQSIRLEPLSNKMMKYLKQNGC